MVEGLKEEMNELKTQVDMAGDVIWLCVNAGTLVSLL